MKLSLKSARINAGYSQEEAAYLLRISQATLSAWERNMWLPNILKALELADLYGVDVKDIKFDAKADKRRIYEEYEEVANG